MKVLKTNILETYTMFIVAVTAEVLTNQSLCLLSFPLIKDRKHASFSRVLHKLCSEHVFESMLQIVSNYSSILFCDELTDTAGDGEVSEG
jgi:hypothetical protein